MNQSQSVKSAWKRDFSDYWTKQREPSAEEKRIMDAWRELHFHGRENLVEEMLNIREGDVFLELGCGDGHFIARYEDKCRTTGIDISDKFCNLATMGAPHSFIIIGDIEQLPLKNECVDACAIVYTFVSVPNKLQALKEMHRVLKEDGKLIVFDPNLLSLRTFLRKLQLIRLKLTAKNSLKQFRLNVLTNQSLSYFGFKKLVSEVGFDIDYWRGNYDTIPFPIFVNGPFSKITLVLLKLWNWMGCKQWGKLPIFRYFSDFIILKFVKRMNT